MNRSNGLLRVGGQGIEYRWLGPAPDQAATVVLLHEGLGCVRMWRDFPDQLQRVTGLGVLVYSRPGHGLSAETYEPPNTRYMHVQALDTLPALLEATAVREIFLLGHSDGGSIATIWAGTRTDRRLLGLITIAAHFFVEDICVQAIKRIRDRYLASVDSAQGLRARLARYHHEQVDRTFHGWADTWLSEDFASWDIRDYLNVIQAPILALQGDKDEYGTTAQLAALHQRYKGAQLQTRLLKNLRHAPHLEQPEIVLETVQQFCLQARHRSCVSTSDSAPRHPIS